MPTQSPRRAVHLFGQAFKAWRGIELGGEQLADPPQPRLASGEFGVLLATAFGHGLMGDAVGQRQGLVKPVFVKGEGVIGAVEAQGAIKVRCVAGLIIRCRMFETGTQQRQWMTEQVVADDFQRDQAELGVEYRQCRIFPVVGGGEPDSLAIFLKAQLEQCSQQRRIAQCQA